MRKLFVAAVIGLSMAVTGAALAEPQRVDRNSAEHRRWQEEFRKKHGIQERRPAQTRSSNQTQRPAAQPQRPATQTQRPASQTPPANRPPAQTQGQRPSNQSAPASR